MLTVAVVIPVYNGAGLLRQAIRSVRDQTRDVDEVIVIDDASVDESGAEAEAQGAHVIRLSKNAGPATARNVGIQAARSSVIAFLDADDEWLPDHCDLLLTALERHPCVDVACARTQLSASTPLDPPRGVPIDALPYLMHANFVPQSACMVRRHAALSVGGYDESRRFSEDYSMWIKLARKSLFITYNNATVVRRLHPGQATWQKSVNLYRAAWELRSDVLADASLSDDVNRWIAVRRSVLAALQKDYRETWNSVDRASFRAVAAAARSVPESARTRWLWKVREFVGWYPWAWTKKLKEQLFARFVRRALNPRSDVR